MTIKDFKWIPGSSTVSWCSNSGLCVEKAYLNNIGSALVLHDGSGIALVEPFEEKGIHNAVIFNEDGSERCRVELPIPKSETRCFYYMHYEFSNLVAVIATTSRDIAAIVNPTNGKCTDVHETR